MTDAKQQYTNKAYSKIYRELFDVIKIYCELVKAGTIEAVRLRAWNFIENAAKSDKVIRRDAEIKRGLSEEKLKVARLKLKMGRLKLKMPRRICR